MPELPDPDERRKRYFEDYADCVGPHREGKHFYEQRAIDFASNAKQQAKTFARAQQQRNTSIEKHKRSDRWRIASLNFVWASLVLFVIGCGAGAYQFLKSDDRPSLLLT